MRPFPHGAMMSSRRSIYIHGRLPPNPSLGPHLMFESCNAAQSGLSTMLLYRHLSTARYSTPTGARCCFFACPDRSICVVSRLVCACVVAGETKKKKNKRRTLKGDESAAGQQGGRGTQVVQIALVVCNMFQNSPQRTEKHVDRVRKGRNSGLCISPPIITGGSFFPGPDTSFDSTLSRQGATTARTPPPDHSRSCFQGDCWDQKNAFTFSISAT